MNKNTKYIVEVIVNKYDEDINNYVFNNGTVYHLTDWSKLIKKVFGHDVYIIYLRTIDGRVVGVLPLIHIKSFIFGNYLTSLPYFNYGGTVADNYDVKVYLHKESIKLANSLNVSHVEYRESKLSNTEMPVRTDKITMILELPDSVEKLSKLIGSKKRSQIRRPLKEGISVKSGGIELIDEFYCVFSENMRDLGTPVYSKSFFKEIIEAFPKYARIFIVEFNHQPIGGAFLLGYKDTLEIPWASTIRRYNKFSPNMLMYWEVLKWAIENNYKYFDFGRCSKDSGTYKFKRQWGAKPKQLYWYYWLATGNQLPNLSPSNSKYTIMINIWKKLPLFIANLLGPVIVKNIP